MNESIGRVVWRASCNEISHRSGDPGTASISASDSRQRFVYPNLG